MIRPIEKKNNIDQISEKQSDLINNIIRNYEKLINQKEKQINQQKHIINEQSQVINGLLSEITTVNAG